MKYSGYVVFVGSSFLLLGASLPHIVGRHSSEKSGHGLSVTPPSAIVHSSGTPGSERRRISFDLKNIGAEPIRITSIDSSCGCTVAHLPKRLLLSTNEVTELVADVDIPGYGTRGSTLSIDFVGKATSRVVIPISLIGRERSVPFVDYFPKRIDLRSTSFDKIREHFFEVIAIEKADSSPWLQGFECENVGIHAKVVDAELGSAGPGEVRRTNGTAALVDREIGAHQ